MIYLSSFNSDAFGNDILNYRNRSFLSPHLHRRPELIWVEQGSLTLHCGGSTHAVGQGSFALILPNELHYFEASPNSGFWVHTFSPSLAPAFFNAIGSRSVVSPVFGCDEATCAYYRALCLHRPPDLDLQDPASRCVQSYLPDGIPTLKLKAALYAVLGCFLEQAQLAERGSGDDALFVRIIHYIAEHFQEEITLKSVARAFGYEPHYLCRYMKSTADVPFRQLVNSYRLDHAKALLEGSELSVTQIALDSGFSCLRTFNRVFLEEEGMSPREYRSAFRTGKDVQHRAIDNEQLTIDS